MGWKCVIYFIFLLHLEKCNLVHNILKQNTSCIFLMQNKFFPPFRYLWQTCAQQHGPTCFQVHGNQSAPFLHCAVAQLDSTVSLEFNIITGVTSVFCQEMCKVDTDSDSEISPRCSDTSTLVFAITFVSIWMFWNTNSISRKVFYKKKSTKIFNLQTCSYFYLFIICLTTFLINLYPYKRVRSHSQAAYAVGTDILLHYHRHWLSHFLQSD